MLLFIISQHGTLSVVCSFITFTACFISCILLITKKLAGTARGTGLWLTSVGNEFGQVLISVLTAQEGAGLDIMVDGLVKRYQKAGVDPPAVLYVDCGCCTEVGETKLKARFRGWPDLMVRLDIWNFYVQDCLGVYN